MHELTIARNIFAILSGTLTEDQLRMTETVRIRIGLLSNILPESLACSFDSIKPFYNLHEAKLEIEIAPLQLCCRNCGSSSQVTELTFSCPSCNSSNLQVIDGDLLEIQDVIQKELL